MSTSPENSPLVKAQSENVALWLSIVGIFLVIVGNATECTIWRINIGSQLANIGALILIIGVLQWFFDRKVRHSFFMEIKREIVGSTRIAESGISDFYTDSKDVDFIEHFISSQHITIGVNYSAKLIDNSIALLGERTSKGLTTTILVVDPSCDAGKFLKTDYDLPDIAHGVAKIQQIVDDIDRSKSLISVVLVKTILRYSFVRFDSRIWVVVGTNGLGRRAVPGFFVSKGGEWFKHFDDDINLLAQRT